MDVVLTASAADAPIARRARRAIAEYLRKPMAAVNCVEEDRGRCGWCWRIRGMERERLEVGARNVVCRLHAIWLHL